MELSFDLVCCHAKYKLSHWRFDRNIKKTHLFEQAQKFDVNDRLHKVYENSRISVNGKLLASYYNLLSLLQQSHTFVQAFYYICNKPYPHCWAKSDELNI